MKIRPTFYLRRALTLRLQVQQAELRTCTTAAMRHCVSEAIRDTHRQLAELSRRAERGCFVGTVAS